MLTELRHDAKTLAAVAGQDLRRRWLSSWLPQSPTTVNLLVNDICNSRCVMCNIWQQKRDIELSPDQLAGVLSDKLYERVEYVGVSGGEPTLRRDLPELFAVICDTLPNLKGTGIITNAIRDQEVSQRVEASAHVCAKRDIDFNVMVSLDGVGDVHDRVRGKAGNFDSAIRVIEDIQARLKLPLSIGCTMTKSNLWQAGELLDYCQQHDIYARFRIGEFIQRLYNFGQTSYIRGFDDDASYHLAMFFTRLEREYETRDAVRRTYRNIAGMLMGAPRGTACPYQDGAVVLDCRGDLQYCAPKSETIGNALETPSSQIYRGNLRERKRIRKQDCATCIHDYHGPMTSREWFGGLAEKYTRRAMTVRNAIRLSNRLPVVAGQSEINPSRRILITGWYGTETVGDKAILGGIVNDYQARYPDAKFSVSSLYPFVTVRTLRELDIKADVVPVYSPRFIKACATHDEVVMGGGPLMDLGELGVVLTAFAIAASFGRRRVVYGCGIGPLQDAFCTDAVKRILKLADVVLLRDGASVDWARRLVDRNDIRCIGDPAVGFVKQRQNMLAVPDKRLILACFLRQWPAGYRGTRPVEAYEQLRERFEQSLGEQIRHACDTLGLRPALYSMHTFFEGRDDRRFNRAFADKYLADLDPIVEIKPSSVDSIIQAMRGASACLTMRFHSVLFTHTLGLKQVAIDYTLGGKINGFLCDHNATDRMVGLAAVAGGRPSLLTDRLLEQGIEARTPQRQEVAA
jgi:MoaA/NifB/PqqE/SkfB family radical SAM enzyme/polysaccharide pyruvyl transferase WcaK-like protein